MHVQAEKDGKFLSMFNIVRFSNYACDAGGNKNGTCYTKDECDQRGGINEGACAEGYGVCCTFTARCGDVSSENNTYFESDGDEKGHCTVKICKAKASIVQLRLDFETFNIAGPSSADTITVATASNNVLTDNGQGTASNLATVCLDDAFAVSNPGGQSPPVICGNNNDMHMYVDASADCNALTFTLSDTTSIIAGRSWTVRVTQYDAGFENLAPAGCTQYFWNKEDSDGTLYSYNYNSGNGPHLADQKQVICIRREENKNTICYSAADADIAISGVDGATATAAHCGGYDAAGPGTLSYADALLIPMAQLPAGTLLQNGNFCGQGKAFIGNMAGTATKYNQICSQSVPFRITFVSDTFEATGTGAEYDTANTVTSNNEGFKIAYTQS